MVPPTVGWSLNFLIEKIEVQQVPVTFQAEGALLSANALNR